MSHLSDPFQEPTAEAPPDTPPTSVQAMHRLIRHEQQHRWSNSASAIRQLVLAVARGWPLELDALRALDDGHRSDALAVIESTITPRSQFGLEADELLERYAELEGEHDG